MTGVFRKGSTLMIQSIIKRDGTIEPFNRARIHTAIQSAYDAERKANGKELPPPFHIQNLVDSVLSAIGDDVESIAVDGVQSAVENELMRSAPDIARRYIAYRHERDVSRETRTKLYADIDGLVNQNRDDILNENANKDSGIISTQRDLLAGIVSRHFGVNHILPKDIAAAHLSGDIHYHDLDHSLSDAWNCCLVDVKEMFDHGFKLGNAHITTPNSITVAAALIPQIITQVASHTYGGTTINRIDEILSPYAEKTYQKHLSTGHSYAVRDVEDYAYTMTLRDIKDAVQAMSYEINTMSSTGGQTPFCTFGFGLGEDRWSIEIQKAILEDRYQGIGPHGDTPVFPKLLYTIKEGHNRKPVDPHYDVKQLALKCSARRMYPDILNYEQVVAVTGGFKACMGETFYCPCKIA